MNESYWAPFSALIKAEKEKQKDKEREKERTGKRERKSNKVQQISKIKSENQQVNRRV